MHQCDCCRNRSLLFGPKAGPQTVVRSLYVFAMCLAGRFVVLVLGLIGLLCLWPWQTSFETELDPSRQLHEDPGATDDGNNTGFVTPKWAPRCEINKTKLNPTCLPEKLFNETQMWDFTHLCGVQAAAASLANLRLEAPVKEISGVLFDNIIATVESFATGVLTVGLLYEGNRVEKKGYEQLSPEEKPGMCKQAFVLVSFCATTYLAVSAGVTVMRKVFEESTEFFLGVIRLETSFACKSVLLSQVLYYKDLLAYLALSSFCVLDVIGILYVAGGFVLSALNLSCQTCWWPTCQAWWSSLLSCCTCFWSCSWCSCWASCCSYLKWYLCQGWWMFWVQLWKHVVAFCGWWRDFCIHCGPSCKNFCSAFCYTCSAFCKACCICIPHCFCCCLCCLPTAGAAFIVGVLLCLCVFPLVVYFLGAVLGFAAATAIILSIMVAFTMVIFYVCSQVVTALRKIGSTCKLVENPPEFRTISEYYGQYFQDIGTCPSRSQTSGRISRWTAASWRMLAVFQLQSERS